MGFFSLITIHFPHHQSDRFDSYTIFVANAAWRNFKFSMFFLEAHFVKHSGDIVCLYIGPCLILVGPIDIYILGSAE